VNAIRQARFNVLKESGSKLRASLPCQPADNQLRSGFNGSEGPDIAASRSIFSTVTFFCVQPTNDRISNHAHGRPVSRLQ